MCACYKLGLMFEFILALLTSVRVFFRSRSETALEILALRQQIVVLKRNRPRPRLSPALLLVPVGRGLGSGPNQRQSSAAGRKLLPKFGHSSGTGRDLGSSGSGNREHVSRHSRQTRTQSAAVEKKDSPEATVISSDRLGGLHHRYSSAKQRRWLASVVSLLSAFVS